MPAEDLFRRIRRIEITTRRLVQQLFAGGYHSVFKGRGIEFAQVREYVPGDDVRLIDWNATARLNKPFIKLFVEERELTVMLLVDISESMNFGTAERLKRQLATELCATLAFSAITNNDQVGLVLFTDRIELMLPPKKGRRHILRLIRELLTYEPAGRGTDLSQAINVACRLMRRAGTLFIVSDFIGVGQEDTAVEKALLVAGKRHDAIAVTICDRHEAPPADAVPRGSGGTLPERGLYRFEDPETGLTRLLDLAHPPTRVPGTAVFLNASARTVPHALLHNLNHNQVLHARLIFLTVRIRTEPWVPFEERMQVERLGEEAYAVTLTFGFKNRPDVPAALEGLGPQYGLAIEPMQTSYFLSRETVVADAVVDSGMAHWREHLFRWLTRNAGSAVEYFNLPSNRVIELGSRVAI